MAFSFTSKIPTTSDTNNSPQQMLLREINYTFETLKVRICEKLDAVRESAQKHVLESTKRNSKKPIPVCFNPEAPKAFEKILSKEIMNLGFDLIHGGNRFQPSITNTIEVPANIGFNYGANVYNPKHNMIIACPSNSTVHFYDASDLTPLKQRKKKEISSSVVQMSYCPETDTHLMGCAFGDIYAYNATANTLNKIMKEGDSFILAIAYLDSNTFAFSSSKSGKLFIGNANGNVKAVPYYSKDSDAWYLHYMNERNLLLSGLANGKIAIYSTNQNARYPMIESVQAHKPGKYVTMITSMKISGREYIVTGGNDHTIKIWHFVKGKMKLLKVIQNNEDVSTIVYLENYNMIACTHHRDYVKFFKLPFGKLELSLSCGINKARNIFLMKDKNMIGVADLTRNLIKVIQLHPTQNNGQSR